MRYKILNLDALFRLDRYLKAQTIQKVGSTEYMKYHLASHVKRD